jgi:hypothetical protein
MTRLAQTLPLTSAALLTTNLAIPTPALRYTSSIVTRRPTIAVARCKLESMISFFGSSRQSTCVRLVLSGTAICALDIFLFFMAGASCPATTGVNSKSPSDVGTVDLASHKLVV